MGRPRELADASGQREGVATLGLLRALGSERRALYSSALENLIEDTECLRVDAGRDEDQIMYCRL